MAKSDGLETIGKTPQCCGQVQVPTEEEVAALNVMREIKTRVRALKDRLKGTEIDSPEGADLMEKIERLKAEWNEWEAKRRAEAKRRMVLLGHEEPDP
jgi:hypothetical protein